MATTDREYLAIKDWLGDVDAAQQVNAILNSGTHASLSTRAYEIIARTMPVYESTDLLLSLQSGSNTISDKTARWVKQGISDALIGSTIVSLINAVT